MSATEEAPDLDIISCASLRRKLHHQRKVKLHMQHLGRNNMTEHVDNLLHALAEKHEHIVIIHSAKYI
jgi:hypothetical protein